MRTRRPFPYGVGVTLVLALAAGALPAESRQAKEERRAAEWKVAEIFRALAVHEGGRVADIGAGEGFLTVRLAEAVGPAGKVFAVDIDERALGELGKRVETLGLKNVAIVRGQVEDPLLAPDSLDGAVVPAGAGAGDSPIRRRPGRRGHAAAGLDQSARQCHPVHAGRRPRPGECRVLAGGAPDGGSDRRRPGHRSGGPGACLRSLLPLERGPAAALARDRAGAGIARSAVETNGGRLEYQQAPGGGSVFRILFAAAQERA